MTLNDTEYEHLIDDIEIAEAMIHALNATAIQIVNRQNASIEEKIVHRLVDQLDEHFGHVKARALKVAS